MKDKTKYYIVIALMGLLIIYLAIPKKEQVKVPHIEFPETSKDSIIRDSIYIVNDSIIKEVQYIDREYDEKVSTIMSSSDSINLLFFSKYIENYNNK